MLFLAFFSFVSIAQDTIQDPLSKFSGFLENTLIFNATRINTNYAEFNTSEGTYSFKKNDFLPTFDARINFGWLFQKNENSSIYSLKTGFNADNRRANLNGPNGEELQLSTLYLGIPVQFGMRNPITFNSSKNNFFRALEYGIGAYISSPVYQKLDHPDNVDASGKTTLFNYLRYGLISEIAFTLFNEKGNGHRFGLRATSDFKSITKIRDTDNDLYPYYINIGVFYNISNFYFKGKS